MAITQRGQKWLVAVDLGRDARGKRVRHYATCDSEDEAKAEQERVRALRTLGRTSAKRRKTVAEWLDEWLLDREHEVAPATYAEDYRKCQVFKAAFGSTRLEELMPMQIRRFERSLRARGLSDSTIRKYRMCIQGALTDAVKMRELERNPARDLDSLPENNPEVRWLSASEQVALVEYARSGFKGRRSRLCELVLVALGTGMRQGELLALRWSDVDFRREVVHMRRSLQWVVDPVTQKITGYRFRTHGKSGSRTVPLPAPLPGLLAEYRRTRRAQLQLAGVTSELVFCGDLGEPLGKAGVRSGFRYLAGRAGLPPEVHFHCLRHTFATDMLEAGVHPKVVAAWIGDSERTLMKTYAHATPTMQEAAVEAAGVRLRGLLGDAAV